MSLLNNKIEAHDRNIYEVLDDKKYTVDYFQREFKWGEKHIEQLVSDLTGAFLNEFQQNHQRKDIEKYNSYDLGPFVVSDKNGQRSIIDGQQRLTSITLFLIYLNNLQKELQINEKLDSLIYSEKYGIKSFNIEVAERLNCIDSLFQTGEFNIANETDESSINMALRYDDIEKYFPDEIKGDSLPYFIDWLKYNVVFVEIVAYSDDNAYTIFETMNDRGLNLTPTEMLKGFILSKLHDDSSRKSLNNKWKKLIFHLNSIEKDEDQRFIQSWFRAKYAETIRQGKTGSKNEDFEKIGTRFHSWFRDNFSKCGINKDDAFHFEEFISKDFDFFINVYCKILQSEKSFSSQLNHVFYIKRWGIANSLSYPLMLAPITKDDDEDTISKKLNLVAKFIETFVVRRSINYRKFASSSIRYTMYTLVKEIRNLNYTQLFETLKLKIDSMEENFDSFDNFRMHGQNKSFIKFLLSRITSYIETESGMNSDFLTYYDNPKGKKYEVEHIWANRFDRFSDEFNHDVDFQEYRNKIGALILLPSGNNQSYGNKSYSKKIDHYLKENLLAKSLNEMAYKNNPNFRNFIEKHSLMFKPHSEFLKKDLIERQKLYQKLCELIWKF
jgi:uncharacterized protein with ParB-like and HNH nuclease domain